MTYLQPKLKFVPTYRDRGVINMGRRNNKQKSRRESVLGSSWNLQEDHDIAVEEGLKAAVVPNRKKDKQMEDTLRELVRTKVT
jgi:hypothetical protein